ncbi:MAG: DUF7288 family protein [Candidatus Methanospirareceae archaeon]
MALEDRIGKEGQMHTIEALLALMIIIGVVTFAALSAPREMNTSNNIDIQLVLYGEDFLSILDMERKDHTSWLYHQVNGTVNGSNWDGAANITREWRNTKLDSKGILCKVEIVNLSSTGLLNLVNSSAPYGEPPRDSITVSRLVTLIDPVRIYEVKLTLWYI